MPRTPSTTPPKRHDPRTSATSRPSTKPVVGAAAKAAPATTERKEETKKEARDAEKMPAREPVRMRRAKAWNVEVENAYRFQCAGWRSAVRVSASRGAVHAIDARRPAQEEYAQGEYGDEISWFSDSGLVEKVQNRQGLFMYFKRSVAASAALRLRWHRRGGVTVDGWRDGVEAPRAVTRRAQAPRVPRQVPAARQDLRVRERRRPQVGPRRDAIDFRTHERKTKTSFRSIYW